MKRIMVFLAVAVVGVALALAQTQVYSVNAVGYVKMTMNPGLNLIRDDFVMIDKSQAKPSKVIGDQLPVATKLYVWNGGGYDIEEYQLVYDENPPFDVIGTNWGPDTVSLDPGSGFWVRMPAEASPVALTLMGEVPNNPTSTVPVAEGLNLIGYSFPVDKKWVTTDLAKKAAVEDKIYVWDGGSYGIYDYQLVYDENPPFDVIGTNWSDTNLVIKVGQGFWYKRNTGAGGVDWIEKRPYDL